MRAAGFVWLLLPGYFRGKIFTAYQVLHERFGGTGYPRGVGGMSIGKFGLISAIVDVTRATCSLLSRTAAWASRQNRATSTSLRTASGTLSLT